MNIGWPEGIYLALVFMSLGIVAANHGEPGSRFSFPTQLFTTVLALGLLWWGGFFA